MAHGCSRPASGREAETGVATGRQTADRAGTPEIQNERQCRKPHGPRRTSARGGVPEVPHAHGGAFLGVPPAGGGPQWHRRQRISHAQQWPMPPWLPDCSGRRHHRTQPEKKHKTQMQKRKALELERHGHTEICIHTMHPKGCSGAPSECTMTSDAHVETNACALLSLNEV